MVLALILWCIKVSAMNVNTIPLLLAFFWQGFSTVYVSLTWLQRLSNQYDTRGITPETHFLARVGYPLRLVLSIFGMSGALGMAGLVGTLGKQILGANTALLVGAVSGILVAYFLSKKSKAK